MFISDLTQIKLELELVGLLSTNYIAGTELCKSLKTIIGSSEVFPHHSQSINLKMLHAPN